MAERAIGMLLTGARGRKLRGRSIAFYGFGAVARATCRRAAALRMDTYAYASGISKDMLWGMGATPAKGCRPLQVPVSIVPRARHGAEQGDHQQVSPLEDPERRRSRRRRTRARARRGDPGAAAGEA